MAISSSSSPPQPFPSQEPDHQPHTHTHLSPYTSDLSSPKPENPNPSTHNKKSQPIPWTHPETINLIQAYKEKWYALKRGQLKASQWEEVSITVAARCGFDEPSKSATQCRHKIEKLRKRYRSERIKPYPNNSWQYFDLMDRMERGSSIASASLQQPIAAHPVAMVKCQTTPNYNIDDDDDDDVVNNRYYETDSDELDDVSYGVDVRKSKCKSINHIVNGVNNHVGSKRKVSNGVQRGLRNMNVVNDKRKCYYENEDTEDDDVDVEEHEEDDDDRDREGCDLAGEIRGFAERFMRMENKKIEMMKETERFRMEMEKKRMGMILETQKNLIDTITGVFRSHKKVKKMAQEF